MSRLVASEVAMKNACLIWQPIADVSRYALDWYAVRYSTAQHAWVTLLTVAAYDLSGCVQNWTDYLKDGQSSAGSWWVSGFDLIAVGKIRKSSKKNRKNWCKKTANFSYHFSQQTIATKPFENIELAA